MTDQFGTQSKYEQSPDCLYYSQIIDEGFHVWWVRKFEVVVNYAGPGHNALQENDTTELDDSADLKDLLEDRWEKESTTEAFGYKVVSLGAGNRRPKL